MNNFYVKMKIRILASKSHAPLKFYVFSFLLNPFRLSIRFNSSSEVLSISGAVYERLLRFYKTGEKNDFKSLKSKVHEFI